VTASEPRIIAITDSTALVIGLTCAPTGWEVVCRPTDTVAPADLRGSEVAVLDLGSTASGLDLLTAVAGDAAAADGVASAGELAVPRAVVIGDDEPAGALPPGTSVLLRPFTLPQLTEAIDALLAPQDGSADRSGAGSDAPIDPVGGEPPSVPATVEPPSEDAPAVEPEPLPARLFGRLAEAARDDVASPQVPHVDPAGADDPRIIELPPSPEPERGTAARPSRWFARRPRPATSGERQLRERLAAVLTATAELERLIEEVPVLASLDGLARAIVDDVASQLQADTSALWRGSREGWHVLAHRGLTPHEATWTVPFDHPLFGEVDQSGGSILIDPVDAVQAAVAGIGGAHTESFMAASIAAGPGRFGILAVGRDRPLTEADLDVLVALATEAAPGIAVAEQLARLRAPTRIELPEAVEARSWRPD
jgi:hypothetical protein